MGRELGASDPQRPVSGVRRPVSSVQSAYPCEPTLSHPLGGSARLGAALRSPIQSSQRPEAVGYVRTVTGERAASCLR